MVKKVGDIEDGFAAKKRHKSKRKKDNITKDEIPPPIAKHILSSYTLSNPASKRAIVDYVEIQARGERVQHAEKIMSEHVFERDYDCWDVHTQRNRWWVITTPTNLYSQKYFPSLDYTLSFHIGVTARIFATQRGAPDTAQGTRLRPVWRRWDQAAESYDSGEEAEDFQAVGMRARETLIQLIRALAKPEMVPEGAEPPKRADVVHWSELIANTVAAGAANDNIRSHLKAIAKSAWQLANWLTHANGATRLDASFVLDATHSAVAAYGNAVVHYESGAPDRCPKCGSYALDVGFNADLPRPYINECERCGWQDIEEPNG